MAQNDTLVNGWQPVIGLEIHVQLQTNTKLFSPAKNQFGEEANTLVDLIDMGLPGVLPVLNDGAVKQGIAFGLATNAEIAKTMVFDRKNYFYPDLPKGYQITQLHYPIVKNGVVDVEGKQVRIHQAHLEEDAGKSIHDAYPDKSVIDLNRAGTPLLEIVSEPEISSAKEAVSYMKALHQLVTFLDVCDGDMSQGSLRCDANVSIRKVGDSELGTRTEIKNINSFKFIEKAINFEIKRQIKVLENGDKVIQETRLYDSLKDETRPMRSKEFANDYRYFPDPDLLPVIISDDEMDEIKDSFPELPNDKSKRYISELKIDENEAQIISSSRELSIFFELAVDSESDPKLAANLLVGEIGSLLNKDNIKINESNLSSDNFNTLLKRISDGTISKKIAKTVLADIWDSGKDADEIIKNQGLVQIQDESIIQDIAQKILEANPDQVAAFKAGKDKLFGFFVGQVMKETQGKANPKSVNDILKKLLS